MDCGLHNVTLMYLQGINDETIENNSKVYIFQIISIFNSPFKGRKLAVFGINE